MTVFWSSPSHWEADFQRDAGCGTVPWLKLSKDCSRNLRNPALWTNQQFQTNANGKKMWVEKFPKSKKTQLVLSDLNPIQGAKIICHHPHKNHHPGPWRTWISETALSKTTSFTDTGGTGSCREQCMSGTFKVTSSKLWDLFLTCSP